MPIYQATMYQAEEIYIVKADSEEDIGTVLERANFEVDGKTVFAVSQYQDSGIDKIIKIGD